MSSVSLQDCLELFTQEETLDGDERPVSPLSYFVLCMWPSFFCCPIAVWILMLHTFCEYRIKIVQQDLLMYTFYVSVFFVCQFFIILVMCVGRHVPVVGSGRSAQNVFQYRSFHKYLLYVSFWSLLCDHSHCAELHITECYDTSGSAARPITMSIVIQGSLCVQRASTTNLITGGRWGQAGQCVAYGYQPETMWLE